MNKLFVEGQILAWKQKIRYAEIVDSDAVAVDEVKDRKTVTVQEVGETDEEVYKASSVQQADAFAGDL